MELLDLTVYCDCCDNFLAVTGRWPGWSPNARKCTASFYCPVCQNPIRIELLRGRDGAVHTVPPGENN